MTFAPYDLPAVNLDSIDPEAFRAALAAELGVMTAGATPREEAYFRFSASLIGVVVALLEERQAAKGGK